jgi:ABC-type phosphate transport system auxiliary subunit
MIRFLRVFEQEGKLMKRLQIVTLALFLLVLVTGTADAQKKTTRKTTTKKTSVTKVVPLLAVRTAREKVEIQLSNVNGFVTKLGPIAQGLETADADRKAGNLSAKTAASIEASKSRLVDAIRILRDGLSALESEFRTKSALQKYLHHRSRVSI